MDCAINCFLVSQSKSNIIFNLYSDVDCLWP